jgi:hypothetical protein
MTAKIVVGRLAKTGFRDRAGKEVSLTLNCRHNSEGFLRTGRSDPSSQPQIDSRTVAQAASSRQLQRGLLNAIRKKEKSRLTL